MYPDDYILLQEQIQARKVNEYLMDIQITSTPHLKQEDARAFIDSLLAEQRRHIGLDNDKLDHEGLQRLKGRLQKESKGIKAK